MACCVALVYLFSMAWRAIRSVGRLVARMPGAASRPGTARFAPVARREVRPPVGAPAALGEVRRPAGTSMR
jgi:hypothetical protein